MKTKPSLLIKARQMRKALTPWEAKLWYHLRLKTLYGFRFRRQFVIHPYIVDFCCHKKMLIIEIDGGQHNLEDNKVKDLKRTEYLQERGYRILRFWNNDIDENLSGVLESIAKELNNPSVPLTRDISPESGD